MALMYTVGQLALYMVAAASKVPAGSRRHHTQLRAGVRSDGCFYVA